MSGISADAMNTNARRIPSRTVPVALAIALATGPVWPQSDDSKASGAAPARSWVKMNVELPTGQVTFPPGNGAAIANAQCLICHSAEMVLLQPALTQDEWTAVINKMRSAFGALLPPDQVEPLAGYLHGINGR